MGEKISVISAACAASEWWEQYQCEHDINHPEGGAELPPMVFKRTGTKKARHEVKHLSRSACHSTKYECVSALLAQRWNSEWEGVEEGGGPAMRGLCGDAGKGRAGR